MLRAWKDEWLQWPGFTGKLAPLLAKSERWGQGKYIYANTSLHLTAL